jgi:hypothetical protein
MGCRFEADGDDSTESWSSLVGIPRVAPLGTGGVAWQIRQKHHCGLACFHLMGLNFILTAGEL